MSDDSPFMNPFRRRHNGQNDKNGNGGHHPELPTPRIAAPDGEPSPDENGARQIYVSGTPAGPGRGAEEALVAPADWPEVISTVPFITAPS